MSNDERDRWINAAKTLAVDVTSKVKCPRCLNGTLSVRDVPVDTTHQDRELKCDACGALEAIFMRLMH
jgi:transcription elongation factor Elf1